MKKKIKLKILSPTHIGTGEKVEPFEFIWAGGKYYAVDPEKFSDVLADENATEKFLAWLNGTKGRETIDKFIAKQPEVLRKQLSVRIKPCIPYLLDCIPPQRPSPREIHRHIKTLGYQPYIPGSSIKGALRNAILYCVVKDANMGQGAKTKTDPNEFAKGKLNELTKNRNQGKKVGRDQAISFSKDFESAIFRGYSFSKNQSAKKEDAHTDIFSCLKVSDSTLLPPDSLAVYQIKVLGITQSFDIWVEAMKPEVELEFAIDIDTHRLELAMKHTQKDAAIKDAVFKWIKNPIGAMQEFATGCLEFEKKAVPKICSQFGRSSAQVDLFASSKEKPNFRIGFGGGMIGNTISILLEEEVRRKIRDMFFKKSSSEIAPKTRKIISDGNLELGWAMATEMG